MSDKSNVTDPDEAARWMLINGRRWRRTDPTLPAPVVEALKSHLGRARAQVRMTRHDGDEKGLAAARRRVGLAKLGLGERGPYWWERDPADRLAQAKRAQSDLDRLAPPHANP
ncbi:biopolymer transporter Tol [Subtercola sp. YIM 133946]|uniref:biopolymer transporter Tol n=1 Tax=Subtercola sp. YIM 133946 TaxID=3118909 RepID=UPI002F92928E